MKVASVTFAFCAAAACGGEPQLQVDAALGDDGGLAGDAGVDAASHVDAGNQSGFVSTLTATCATLQGRAVVNYNDNLGASFTDDDFVFLGSVQFQLPDGFTGKVPNPENWDGQSERHVVAVTSPAFELFGNHCWVNHAPPAQPGTVAVDLFDPFDGRVKATFSSYVLHSCVGTGTCTVSGTIETPSEGTFEE